MTHWTDPRDKPEATRMLLEAGVDVNIENPKGETALHNACHPEAIDEATSLIEKGANLVLNKKNKTPALENLLFENQDIEKVSNLMTAIHKSNYKLKANGDALTPNLETFFTKERSSKMTDILIKGLIQKTKMKLR